VILRLSPRTHVHEVTQIGTCSVGCGRPRTTLERTSYVLPSTDPAKVEVVDVPYDRDQLQVHCTKEIHRG
jgi:hypothetical protein